MKLLHTSDWHLGRTLYGRRRDREFEDFLQWMVQQVNTRQADVLVIAGDIFDTTTPSNRAQAQYYQFLHQLVASPCRHVIIVAGNHDSPTFLNAPAALLSTLGVHVIGHAMQDVTQQVIVLRDAQHRAQMIVCAVPYLRDRDVRTVTVGESPDDKERNLVQGIQAHYRQIAQHARDVQASLDVAVPIVATGHLFAAGGQVIEGDGVRDLYIGCLGQIGVNVFDDAFDYVALGHLHVPQVVAGQAHIRYSGSPIAMGFGEAGQRKVIVEVNFSEDHARVDRRLDVQIATIDVPVFHRLMQIRGDLANISAQIEALQRTDQTWWVEVLYESPVFAADVRQQVEQLTTASNVEVLRIKVSRPVAMLRTEYAEQTLEDLSPEEVFERCLQAHQVAPAQRIELLALYRQIMAMHAQGMPESVSAGDQP